MEENEKIQESKPLMQLSFLHIHNLPYNCQKQLGCNPWGIHLSNKRQVVMSCQLVFSKERLRKQKMNQKNLNDLPAASPSTIILMESMLPSILFGLVVVFGFEGGLLGIPLVTVSPDSDDSDAKFILMFGLLY